MHYVIYKALKKKLCVSVCFLPSLSISFIPKSFSFLPEVNVEKGGLIHVLSLLAYVGSSDSVQCLGLILFIYLFLKKSSERVMSVFEHLHVAVFSYDAPYIFCLSKAEGNVKAIWGCVVFLH